MGVIKNNSNFISIDIGTTGVRLVQLRHSSGGNPVLVTYGDAPLPEGIALSDSPIDRDKISAVIKQLVADTKASTTDVVAGIQSNKAYATVVKTPKLNEGELAKAMKLQADQYIPMAIDQVKMDWQIIGPGATDQEMEVLLVAAPNTVAEKYLTIIENAGLNLVALDINAIALARSLATDDLAVVILDVSSISSDIAIVHNRVPKLIRSVEVGSAVFRRAVGENLGLDEAQADQFMRRFGLVQTKLEGQVFKAIKPSLDLLTDEISKSIQFFNKQNEGVKLEKLILTGGTAALPEFPTHLANTLGIPVEIGNPWGGVSYPADQQEKLFSLSTEYAVAIGLAERNTV